MTWIDWVLSIAAGIIIGGSLVFAVIVRVTERNRRRG